MSNNVVSFSEAHIAKRIALLAARLAADAQAAKADKEALARLDKFYSIKNQSLTRGDSLFPTIAYRQQAADWLSKAQV